MMSESHSQSEHVLHKLGGINAAARLLGHANSSTVQGWKKRGFVPSQRYGDILAKARAAGIDLKPVDFINHLLDDPDGPSGPAGEAKIKTAAARSIKGAAA